MEDQVADLTPRKAGELLDLTHLEVIRRIRRGQIRARKLDGGWYWLIKSEEVQRVQTTAWYKRLMRLRNARAKSS
jgi:hypothetical protein